MFFIFSFKSYKLKDTIIRLKRYNINSKHQYLTIDIKSMGNSSSTLNVLNIPIKQLQSDMTVQTSTYIQPFRQFSTQYFKKSSTSSKHESIILIKSPQKQHKISLIQHLYIQIQQAYQQKSKNFQLQTIVFDQYYVDRVIYLVKDDLQKKTIILRQFQQYQTNNYGNIAFQVELMQQLAQKNNKNILKLKDNYLIQAIGINFKNNISQVIELEPIQANLAEVIQYRRENKWEWAAEQFDQLVYDLINGLNTIHSLEISHNDIRPQNIFYSYQKQCYVIGQFSYAVRGTKQGNLRTNRASKYFIGQEMNKKQTYDLIKADLYSLGTTLLCALYLCNPIDIEKFQRLNSDFTSSSKNFKYIKSLLSGERMDQILGNLKDLNYVNKQMKLMIQSLRFKLNPRNKNPHLYKQISCQFYKRFGLWESWMGQLDQLMESDHTLNNYQFAKLYQEKALIQYCQDQLDESTNYAKRAANLYRTLGNQAFKQGDFNLALKNYTIAIQCSKFYVNKNDLDLAKSLICMSKVHAQKRQENYSKILLSNAQDLVVKQSTKQSILYSQIKIKQGQLLRKFFKYQDSLFSLSQALQVARKMSGINQKASTLCQAKILTLIAQNEISLAKISSDPNIKSQKLQAAQTQLNHSKDLYVKMTDQYSVNCYVELAQNTQVLGQLYLQKKDYQTSKSSFQTSLKLRRQDQQRKNQSKFIPQHGLTLSNIGRCQRLMNSQSNQQVYKSSLEHQQEALEVFRKAYGSDHNYYSACVLKEMSTLYQKMGKFKQSNECSKCSRKIFTQLYGQNSPYDQIGDDQKMFRE